MAGRLGGHRGGIEGLLQLIDEHGEALEYDLIRLGLRLDDLGTERLSWRDLLVIVQHSPRDSALARDLLGDDALWGVTEHLLASLLDAVQMGNWQRGGKPHAPKPKPVRRPGARGQVRHFGADPIPISQFDDWWDNGGG